MKILLVEFTSLMSGAERSLIELIAGLREEHDVTLACPRGPLEACARELGVAVELIPASQLTFRLHPRHTLVAAARMGAAAVKLRSVARGLRPAVIHANSVRAGLLASPAARGVAPLVVHCRDVLPAGPLGTAVRMAVLTATDQVVAISRHVATSFAGPRWATRRVRIVHNAVDFGRFDPASVSRDACRASLRIAEGPVLSVIAQITPWKGQDLAIEVLARLRRRHQDAILLVVGEAKFVSDATRHDNRAFERRLHDLVGERGVGDYVRFLGERPDPERILAATDVLLVPSVEEPFGRTIIEAMAMAIPVVATDVGGPAEILKDGIGGRLVAGRDIGAWTDAVHTSLQASASERGAARSHAESRFSRDRHLQAMLAVYADAIRRRAQESARTFSGPA